MADPRLEERLARLGDGVATWNEHALEQAPAIWHDDMVWVEPAGFPDAGTHHGLDACVSRMRERLSLLGEVKLEIVGGELRGDRLLIETVVRGQGASSGIPTELREYWIYEFADDDRVLRWLEFLDRDEAEAALAELG